MELDKVEKKDIKVDGFIEAGKQFDLDITLPEDHRNVIYGVVKDCYGEYVENAIVKLIEVNKKDYKEDRLAVSHSFTDKNGEFVFGPLCPNKNYELQIWVDNVKHIKVCPIIKHEGKCLRGEKHENCKHPRNEDINKELNEE